VILTRERERELQQEIERIRHELDVEFANRLREARAFGETGQNDDYLQIKEEEAVVSFRLHRLRSLLQSARVRDDSSETPDSITLGSTVAVTNLDTRTRRSHRITGAYEPLRAGEVSISSPVGQALMGRRENDEVAIAMPTGAVVRLRVDKVAGR
jgi:transcription elongation factor GreA